MKIIQNFDGIFHGPMRLRNALANDYQVPVETLKAQMGIENVTSIASSFGIDLNDRVSHAETCGRVWRVWKTGNLFWAEY